MKASPHTHHHYRLAALLGILLVVGGISFAVFHQFSAVKPVRAATDAAVPPTTQVTAKPSIQGPTYKYANGVLPLGDGKVTSDGPKKGYVYTCSTSFNDGGAQHTGDWISGDSWQPSKKLHVQGDVAWPNAATSDTLGSRYRTIRTNDLPTDHTTGIFPIATTDPAYNIDHNPNIIRAQAKTYYLPANPTALAQPGCVGQGEIGVMTDGVLLFNALDASGRDAAAHEVQDHCDGHPDKLGKYHYHSLSNCFKDTAVTTVLGFALDGYPITGPTQADGIKLTTDDLDECHGMSSPINLDGKLVTTYHYVMTEDYPYSISCFKGKAIR